ncbi:DnaJ-domain-containing protein [Vararia minispora EC-137]|uniref:DnaJ-domain-containing protein n=1 Tax=Vararia minispora EC-137 TaxID=1314806 RepID=A0ACB8QL26_9AGAM|nr:DnaJ-domain-containing protein [Vararia minispora EC-137]
MKKQRNMILTVAIETELYDILGVSVTATEVEIKKAYRKKAKDLHPNPNDPKAIQNFQEMAAAYEILSDPHSRAAYDSMGIAGVDGRGEDGGPSMDDVFQQFFGAGAGSAHFGFDFGPGMEFGFDGARTRARDEVIPYEVTLEDLYNGKNVKMNMEKEVECPTCRGSGGKPGVKSKQCVKCEGKGSIFVQTAIGPGKLGTSRQKCQECDGRGEKIREKDRCKKCKGERTVKEKARQEIFVEKGMSHGQRIVLAGAGDQEPGLPPGDVIFLLKMQPHETFERSGNDLLTTVQITLSEALLGFDRILITHLDGRGIKVASPPNKVIKPQQTIILRGEGMPTYKTPDVKGDLYIILEIEMPSDHFMRSINITALQALLPPKRIDPVPEPVIVDSAHYEEADMAEVRERAFPASSDFFDHASRAQFGDGDDDDEDAWEDEDDDGEEPECRTQ